MFHRRTIMVLILLTLVLAVLTILSLWLYAPGRPEVLFISDAPYAELYLSWWQTAALRFAFALNGMTFETLKIPASSLGSQDVLFNQVTERIDRTMAMIVCSPMVTAAISAYDDVWEPLIDETVPLVGIGDGDEQIFDLVLKRPRIDEGWASAAAALATVVADQPLPTVLLYEANDVQAERDARLFSETFHDGVLDVKAVSSRLEGAIKATVESLTQAGTLHVVVPYVEHFDQYVLYSQEVAFRWIVDATYVPILEGHHIEGVVADDLAASLIPLVDTAFFDDPGHPDSVEMVRTYRSGRTAFRNSL